MEKPNEEKPKEENPTFKYKTLLLNVPIHCEGCSKQVMKTLLKMKGVYKVDIDLNQNKVTIFCDVDPQKVIKRLHKSGKQASIWQDPAEPENQVPATSTDQNNPGNQNPATLNDQNEGFVLPNYHPYMPQQIMALPMVQTGPNKYEYLHPYQYPYGPVPDRKDYLTNNFNEENTSSCSVM